MGTKEHRLGADLRPFTDRDGRYDAGRIAAAFDWEQREIARFLGKDPSSVSKNPTALSYQDQLARLVSLFNRVVALAGGDFAGAVAWLRTPIWALDHQSPKALLLNEQMPVVERLVREYDSALAG